MIDRHTSARLVHIIRWIAVGFGVAFFAAAAVYRDWRLMAFTVVVLTVGVGTLHIHRLVMRGDVTGGMRTLVGLLLFTAVAGAVAYPPWVVTMTILPLMAMGIAQLAVPRARLRRVAAWCIGVELVVVSSFFAVPPVDALPPWLVLAFGFGHFVAAVVVTLLIFLIGADELQRRAEAAVDARRRNERFILNISHELHTPLNAVLGFAQLLEEESHNLDAEQAAYLRHVVKGAHRLREVSHDLVEIQCVRESELVIEPVSLRGVVSHALALARERAPDGELQADIEDVTVQANHDGLVRVLSHLITSSRRNSPQGDAVVVQGADQGDHALIRIRDQGPPLTPEQLQHLFTYMETLEPHQAMSPRAEGIQLPLARTLAEAMGAELQCSSDAQGTEFTVRLPVGHP